MNPCVRIAFTIIMTWLVLSGCTKQIMSPEDLEKMTTRTYTDLSPNTILHAASDLFFLADDQAFEQTQSLNHLLAIRKHGLDIGLTFVEAQDTWKVETQKTSQGTLVRLNAKSDETWLTGKSKIQTPQGPATYQQFWNRLDYLLGQSTTWMTCRDLFTKYVEDQTWGDTWWLCSEVADRVPPELEEGRWQKARGVLLSLEDHNACTGQTLEDQYGKTQSERQQAVYYSLCLQKLGYKKVKVAPPTNTEDQP